LVLNGIQTQSAKVYNLLPEVERLRKMGVDVVRISPQSQHTSANSGLFHGVMTQQTTVQAAMPGHAGFDAGERPATATGTASPGWSN
jgi:hypothetical protein